MPRKPPPREPPAELDGDLRPTDIVDELQRLTFDRQFNAIKIDRDVRDYLVTALNVRHTARRD